MEPLNETTVIPLLPTARVGGGLARWLGRREFILRVLAGGMFLSLFLNVALSVVVFAVIQKGTVVVVLDELHRLYRVVGESFERARELQEETALLATIALLNRDTASFELGDLLPRLFTRGTQALAEQLRLNEQADFTQRQLRQTATIARIEVRTSQWSGIDVLVTGQLRRTGKFAGQAVDETVPFTLRLALAPNRDLVRANRYPLMVEAFTLTYASTHP